MKQSNWAYGLATWGGVGRMPVAPGTMGSVAAAGMAWVMVHYAGFPVEGLAALALALFYPAAKASGIIEAELGAEDPGFIVVDEVVGQWLALAAVRPDAWPDWVLAIALFRIFDVLKPPPIRRLEKIPGGVGVIADDAAAGLCAMMLVIAYRWFWVAA